MNTVVSVLLLIVSGSFYAFSDRAIALYILEHLNDVNDLTAAGICDHVYVSSQAVKKFCRQLGYRNFQEFRRFLSYTKEIRKGQMIAHFMNMSEESILTQIRSYVPDLDVEAFRQQVETINRVIYEAERIIILGSVYPQMLSLHYAEDMLMFNKTVWSEPISQEIQTAPQEGTVILVISLTGRIYQFYPEFFMKCQKSRHPLITIGNAGMVPDFVHPAGSIFLPVGKDDETENSMIPVIFQYMKYRYGMVYGGCEYGNP